MRKSFIIASFVFLPLFVSASESPWTVMADAARGGVTSAITIDQSSVFSFSTSLLAFVAAGGSPDSAIVQSFIDKYYTNNQIGNLEYLNDDFWGILALRSAGVLASDAVIRDARSLIEKAQRPNGGWSWSPTYPVADTDDTAAAIMALLESGAARSDASIQKALGYIRSAQNIDGGFPNVPPATSSIESTAWVVSALWKAGEDPKTWSKSGKDPMTYLHAQEKSDGSFGGAVSTAYVVIALAGKSYPVRSYVPPVILEAPQQEEVPQQKIQLPPPEQPSPVVEKVIKKPVVQKVIKKIMKKAVKKPKKTSPPPSPKRRGKI
ncbi:terpene cyclase/mutase family protein [Candidatus Uhrbacteria bacterium]|nr:terpene cyclase/mutase family protein [Candidatus Uhrbacteria bacterium]